MFLAFNLFKIFLRCVLIVCVLKKNLLLISLLVKPLQTNFAISNSRLVRLNLFEFVLYVLGVTILLFSSSIKTFEGKDLALKVPCIIKSFVNIFEFAEYVIELFIELNKNPELLLNK